MSLQATGSAKRPARGAERTPERQALADAIARRGAAEHALADARRSVTRVGDAVTRAESRLEAANEAIAAAAETNAAEVVAGRPANAMQAARFVLAAAQDEYDAATAAHAKLSGRLPGLEDELRAAGHHVVVAVDAVIRCHAAELLADAEDLVARLRSSRTLLRFMLQPEITAADANTPLRAPLMSEDWDIIRRTLGDERATRRNYADSKSRRARDEPFAELAASIDWFLRREVFGSEQLWAAEPLLAPWQEARKSLMQDADAPLPPI